MPTRRLLLALVALLTLAGSLPAAAQTPVASPGASPVPGGFVLVATITVDQWQDPLRDVLPGIDLGHRSLLDALREGGFVIYFRHAATDSASDQNVDLANCATQRNLSQRGKDQAAAIGAGFEELGIPVGEVRSSEFCRTRETAELAFGEVTPDPMLTPLPEDSEVEKEAKAAALAELLSTPPEPGTNTVIVAHQSNIAAVLPGMELDEGEAAVFLPAG
jgi:phosphohistidine phosphatase SixA